MALSIRERCLAAVATALADVATTVARNTDRAFSPDELPAAVVFDGPHAAAETFTGVASFSLDVGIELLVSGEAGGTALNALYADTVAALLADRTLGGVAVDLREVDLGEPEHLTGARAVEIVSATLRVEVLFETAEADRTALPG